MWVSLSLSLHQSLSPPSLSASVHVCLLLRAAPIPPFDRHIRRQLVIQSTKYLPNSIIHEGLCPSLFCPSSFFSQGQCVSLRTSSRLSQSFRLSVSLSVRPSDHNSVLPSFAHLSAYPVVRPPTVRPSTRPSSVLLSICLSVRSSARPSFLPPVIPPVRPPVYPSVLLPVRSARRSFCPSVLLPVRPSGRPSFCWSVHLPVRPSARPFVHLDAQLFIYPLSCSACVEMSTVDEGVVEGGSV